MRYTALFLSLLLACAPRESSEVPIPSPSEPDAVRNADIDPSTDLPRLSIEASSGRCLALLDGRLLSETPVIVVDLNAADYTVSCKWRGHQEEVAKRVHVSAGEPTLVVFDPPPSD